MRIHNPDISACSSVDWLKAGSDFLLHSFTTRVRITIRSCLSFELGPLKILASTLGLVNTLQSSANLSSTLLQTILRYIYFQQFRDTSISFLTWCSTLS